jgi:hypothetical protein
VILADTAQELQPNRAQLDRYFLLDDADRKLVRGHRGDHNRLGFALQLVTVRFLGTFLSNRAEVPVGVVDYVARKVGVEGIRRVSSTTRRAGPRSTSTPGRSGSGTSTATSPTSTCKRSSWGGGARRSGVLRPGDRVASLNWRGRPLSHEVIVELIAATSTRTGLKVRAELDQRDYPKGTKITDKELAALPLTKHEFHGEWNYTLVRHEAP